MGNYSAAMLEAIKQKQAIHTLFSITFPHSGVRRWSSGPVRKAGVGAWIGKIVRQGSIYLPSGDVGGSIVYPKLDEVTVQDMDGEIGKIFELERPEGSLVEVFYAAKDVAQEDWFQIFGNGRLDDWKKAEDGCWTLISTYNELPFRSPFPAVPIRRSQFPRAARPEIYGHYAYLVYGTHFSVNNGDKGMAPSFHIDTTLGWFGPWIGYCNVTDVYLNDELQENVTDYNVLQVELEGQLFTVVQFVTPPDPADNPVVTVDIVGLHSNPDGTGTELEGTYALRHALTNFVFPSTPWKSGAYFDDSTAPISITHFDEMQTALETWGWGKSSRIYGGTERITAEKMIEEFCSSKGRMGACNPMFTFDGKFGLRPTRWDSTTQHYSGNRRIRYDSGKQEPGRSLLIERHRNALANQLDIKSVFNTSTGEYNWAFEIHDTSVLDDRRAVYEMPWSLSQIL